MTTNRTVEDFFNEEFSESSILFCWLVATIQIFFAVVLLTGSWVYHHRMIGSGEKKISPKKITEESDEGDVPMEMSKKNGFQPNLNNNDLITLPYLTDDQKASPLFKTKRSEKNFLKMNDDVTINFPSDYGPEYINVYQKTKGVTYFSVVFQLLKIKKTRKMVATATGFALLSSGMSSILAILVSYSAFVREKCSGYDDEYFTNYAKEWNCEEEILGFQQYLYAERWILGVAKSMEQTITLFSFLPIFLMLAALAFLVDRWRDFMATCHSIQGAIQDIAIMCGTIPDATPLRDSSRKKLYKIYRYLNVIHVLCHKSFSPSLRALNEDCYLLETALGLLTNDEARMIQLAENKSRDLMLGLLSHAVDDLMDDSIRECVYIPKATVLNSKICDLRGNCGKLHVLFVRDNPNEYSVSVSTFIHVFKILVVLMAPFQFLAANSLYVFCFQPGVFIGVFFTYISLSFPSVLYQILRNPFSENSGIKADNLIANTELALFQTLRVLWHKAENENIKGLSRSEKMKRLGSSIAVRKSRFRGSVAVGGFGEL